MYDLAFFLCFVCKTRCLFYSLINNKVIAPVKKNSTTQNTHHKNVHTIQNSMQHNTNTSHNRTYNLLRHTLYHIIRVRSTCMMHSICFVAQNFSLFVFFRMRCARAQREPFDPETGAWVTACYCGDLPDWHSLTGWTGWLTGKSANAGCLYYTTRTGLY